MDYVICPFNTEHKVRGTELRMHLMTCQSKREKEQDEVLDPHPSTKKKTKWMAISLKQEKDEEERILSQVDISDPQDPNRLLQCPYDSNHQIRASRFPYHLIKCRKNHPDLASQFVTCPFNARHMVPRGELSYHISRCDDQSCIEQVIADDKSKYKRDLLPSQWNAPPCAEDWDEELQSTTPFVWGTPSYPVPSSQGSTLIDSKNNLDANLRAPKSLPYVLPWKVGK